MMYFKLICAYIIFLLIFSSAGSFLGGCATFFLNKLRNFFSCLKFRIFILTLTRLHIFSLSFNADVKDFDMSNMDKVTYLGLLYLIIYYYYYYYVYYI